MREIVLYVLYFYNLLGILQMNVYVFMSRLLRGLSTKVEIFVLAWWHKYKQIVDLNNVSLCCLVNCWMLVCFIFYLKHSCVLCTVPILDTLMFFCIQSQMKRLRVTRPLFSGIYHMIMSRDYFNRRSCLLICLHYVFKKIFFRPMDLSLIKKNIETGVSIMFLFVL